MRFLADVNVVFPLLLTQHSHRTVAMEWFDSANSGEVVLCRLVRLGVLRLLSNVKVMGVDVLEPKAAWEALGTFEADDRIVLTNEPPGIDPSLERLVAPCKSTPNLWTDAYLAAMASVTGLKLVTFDKGFSKFAGFKVRILSLPLPPNTP